MDITHFLKEVHPTYLFVVPEIIEVVEKSLYQAGNKMYYRNGTQKYPFL